MDDQTTTGSTLPTTEELTATAKKLNEQIATLYKKSVEEIKANPWRYATIAGGLAVAIAAVCGGAWYKRH